MSYEKKDYFMIEEIEDKGLTNAAISSEDLQKLYIRGLLAIKRLHSIQIAIHSDLNNDSDHLIEVINNLVKMPLWDDFPGTPRPFDEPMGEYQKSRWDEPACYASAEILSPKALSEEDIKKTLKMRPDLKEDAEKYLERLKKYQDKKKESKPEHEEDIER